MNKKIGYGIDFGTTNSIISKYDTDFNQWTNFTQDNGRPHPSVVWYRPNNSVVVGEEAKKQIKDYSIELGIDFISSVKRKLGFNYSYHIFGKDVNAINVASEIFSHLKKHTDIKEGEKFEAVVTIPVDFNGKARRDLRKAAAKAGIYIKSFIQEPYAAIVAHCWKKVGNDFTTKLLDKNYLVMDWGGGTLDITVAKVTENGFEVLAFKGNNEVGGDIFDKKLMKSVSNSFIDKNKLSAEHRSNFNSTSNGNLKYECEQCKIRLSEKYSEYVDLPNFYRIEDRFLPLSVEVPRKEFENLIEEYVDAGTNLMLDALVDSGLKNNEIDSVLLIGGTCNIPLIKNKMLNIFGSRVEQVDEPDLIIAQGAALIDGIGLKSVLQNDVTLKMADNSYFTIYESQRNLNDLNTYKKYPIYCTDPRDGFAKIIVTDMKIPQKKTLGILSVPVASNYNLRYGCERIELSMYFDEDMILHLSGKSETQQKKESIEIYDIPFGLSLNNKGI